MNENFVSRVGQEVNEIKASGLYKTERTITSPQGAEIMVNGKTALNFCANNYLGLSSHPKVIEAAHAAIESHGYGMSSVRFICGTQDIHKELEQKIAQFLGTEDSILYAACFDANGGVFESLFNENDAIISLTSMIPSGEAETITLSQKCLSSKSKPQQINSLDMVESVSAFLYPLNIVS